MPRLAGLNFMLACPCSILNQDVGGDSWNQNYGEELHEEIQGR